MIKEAHIIRVVLLVIIIHLLHVEKQIQEATAQVYMAQTIITGMTAKVQKRFKQFQKQNNPVVIFKVFLRIKLGKGCTRAWYLLYRVHHYKTKIEVGEHIIIEFD